MREKRSVTSNLRPGTRGLHAENDLLAITSAQIIELNQNLGHIKNSSSLTFESIDIVLISHLIYQMTVWLKNCK